MSKIINVGRVTSYADAVAGGYTGTREQWEHDLANLGTVAAEVEADRAEVAENTATVAEDKAAVVGDRSAAESAAGSAAESAASAHTDAIAATAAKEAAQTAQGLAENAASTAANAKDAAQTAQGKAEDAQTAAEAAQTAAEDAQTAAAGSANAAAESATAAAESEATAQHIADMYPTDKTLSVVDKAADGKATGDAVADLNSAIEQYPNSVEKAVGAKPLIFVNGAYPTPDVGETADLSAPVIDPAGVHFRTAKAPFVPGQKITYKTGGGSSSYRVLCYYDADYKVVLRGVTNAQDRTSSPDPAQYPDIAWVVINTTGSDFYAYIGDGISAADIDYLTESNKQETIAYGIFDKSTNAGMTVEAAGNIITINGTSGATVSQSSTKISITDHVQIWNSATTPSEVQVYPVKLVSGHTYSLTVVKQSGTIDKRSGTGTVLVSVYDSDSTLYASCITNDDNSYSNSVTFTAGNYPLLLRMYVARLATLTNAVFSVVVRDITYDAEIDETNSKVGELSDAIGTYDKRVALSAEQGYYWNSQNATAVKTEHSNFKAYNPIPLVAGKQYKIVIPGIDSTKTHPVLITDENYGILRYYGTTEETTQTFTFTASDGDAYILMSARNSRAGVCYTIEYNSLQIIAAVTNGAYDFKGKNIAIIGDSISTNGNWSYTHTTGNVPEIVIEEEDIGVELSAYPTYYDIGVTVGGHEITASDVGTELTFTPVSGDKGKIIGKPDNANSASVDVWWEVCANRLGFNPICVSWSGASLSSHEGDSNTYKTSYAWHPAQIRKCGIRTPGSMTRTAPDMVIIYRGTNDFSHSPYAKLTDDYFGYPWAYPDTDVIDGGYGVKEALCLTVKKLREAYPEAIIVLCTCNFFKRIHYSSYPVNNGQYTENQLNNAIREVAEWLGCRLIEFDKDGLTFENASSEYYQDATAHTHPTTLGHRFLANRAMRDLSMINARTEQ